MKKIWLTYAWLDNTNLDVDFVRQEIIKAGAEVLLDRWEVAAGASLWQNIEAGIRDPNRSDAWAIYATEEALRRSAVREELDWALNRALISRSKHYPLIGIFPGPVPEIAIPAPIKVRRYVTLAEPAWQAVVVAAACGFPPKPSSIDIPLTYSKWHQLTDKLVLELRPRAGVWNNFCVLVPECDRAKLSWVSFGAPNSPFRSAFMHSSVKSYLFDGRSWSGFCFPSQQPNPTQSVYIDLLSKPLALMAGVPCSEGLSPKFILQPNGSEQAL
jgi:hypothetical protein